MIVVCKKFRLIEQSNGKFKINEHRKQLRSSVKIDKLAMEAENKLSPISGIHYEIDEKSTDERNKIINNKSETKLDRNALKLEADSMGLEYAKNIKTEALKELIETNR